jgi:2-oxoisovalerate ferredoxin oxidoreductase beta subunit
MANAFFKHFDRHAHGKGLKGATTHYCPGCGHGLAHKYLAEAIDDLGIQDRTIAISPVGCAVFLYYYFDVGNTQAAHGRAPAVAVGHKLANPESVVVSYQGDGDLAAIGLAEIMSTAQVGLPISVIFINNAIYGMTGGQMAPTTLMGQESTTSPNGRGVMEGEPMHVSEMIARLDGPIYVERTALFDQKTRRRTQRAIKKVLQLQMEGRGFGFVEILSECPVHWNMTPIEAEAHVRDHLAPVYPLGVLKDVEREPWFGLEKPSFDPDLFVETLEAGTEEPPSFAKGPGPVETVRRRPRCSSPKRPSMRGSMPRIYRATVPSRGAVPPTPTCTSRARRSSRPPRRSRLCSLRSTRRVSPSLVPP